jgi:hypothetical protein
MRGCKHGPVQAECQVWPLSCRDEAAEPRKLGVTGIWSGVNGAWVRGTAIVGACVPVGRVAWAAVDEC